MSTLSRVTRLVLVLITSLTVRTALGAEIFRVATYNLEGYLDEATETRKVKATESRAKIRESIRAMRPDVLALQEVGTTNALLELQTVLKQEGLDLPHWLHVAGADTNIHVAILSKFPFARSHAYTNEQFLLSGHRFRVSRGFGEVEIQVTPTYRFTLLTAHLKSKRAISSADESELRLEEAKLLREKIDKCLKKDAGGNLVVAGDFNDTQDAASTKMIIGRGRLKLIDTRPEEENREAGGGNRSAAGEMEMRQVTWTHYYGKEDSYRRIDYLLLSPGMSREWLADQTFIPRIPGWGAGSDHRPLVAAFLAEDK